MLFLCENNGKYGAGRATGAAQSSTMAAFPLTDLPRAYKIPAQQIDGLDSGMVHATISEAVEKDSPWRRTTVYRNANRTLARQRNQLAIGHPADRFVACMGREWRTGESS